MRQHYPGVSVSEVRLGLQESRSRLRQWQQKVRPLSPEYDAISAARKALDDVETAITGKPRHPADLLGARTPSS
ncbi:MAG: hypothetical protein KF842_06675 [Caulobacter sp.]|nr:hypothetical protein [Caulobacter sp.]